MQPFKTALIDLFNTSDDFVIEIENQIISLHESLRSQNTDAIQVLQNELDNEIRPLARELISELVLRSENASWMDRRTAGSLIRDITHQLNALEWAIENQENLAA